MHTFNSNTWQAQADRSRVQVPEKALKLQRNSVLKNQKRKRNRRRKEKKRMK